MQGRQKKRQQRAVAASERRREYKVLTLLLNIQGYADTNLRERAKWDRGDL